MAVTITSVQGTGAGTTPATIHVDGTASGCESIEVSSPCSDKTITVQQTATGTWSWSADLPNDKRCGCGAQIRVDAWCTIGAASGATSFTGTLQCGPPTDCWDDVTLTTPSPLPCAPQGGTVNATFTAQVTPVTPAYAGGYEWEVRDQVAGAIVQPFTAGGAAFTFAFAAGTYRVRVRVRQPDCDQGDLIDADSFTIAPCGACALTVSGPTTTPCVSGGATAPQNYTAQPAAGWAGPFTWEVDSVPAGTAHSAQTGGSTVALSFPGPGTYTVRASVQTAGCPTPTVSGSLTVVVPSCDCPIITGPLTAAHATPCDWTFTLGVTPPPGNHPVSYDWSFGDGTTATTTTPSASHTYASDGLKHVSVTVRSSGCPDLTATVDIGVDGCKGPPGNGGGTSSPPPSSSPPPPSSTPPPTPLCGILLVIAIILLLLGAVIVIIGVCIAVPWVWIVGAIVGALGLILFIIWAIVCAALTPCPLMRTMHCILFWIVSTVAPVIVIIAAITGGLPCAIAAAAAWGGWGTLYAWLGFIMRRVMCPPTC